MKKIFLLVILIILNSLLLISQQLVQNYGNNHITNSSISFTPDGKIMLTGGYAKLYDMMLGSIDFRTIPKDTETQSDYSYKVLAGSDNQSFLITKINRIELWDLVAREMKKAIRDNQLIETAVCYSNDGRNIIYVRKNGEIVFVNTTTYEESVKKKIPQLAAVSINLSLDGKNLLIGTKDNKIAVYDVNSQAITSVIIDGREIQNIEFSPHGDFVAVSSADGRIWLGKYPSMDRIRSWKAHSQGLTSISFHPSGMYLASGGKDKIIRIWAIPDCSKIAEWEAHKLPITSIAFSPAGEQLASGSQNELFIGGGDDTKVWSFADPARNSFSKSEITQVSSAENLNKIKIETDEGLQKRIALVIGNGNYISSVLANPENDAREMKSILVEYGFDVLEYENLDQSQMKRAIDEFGLKLKNYDVGLFFYAGHGIQSKGYNYLIPVDAKLSSEEQIEYDCVQADRVLAVMEASGASVNIMILDACRNNPFERSWTRSGSGRGLAFMNAPTGTLIAYATAPGSTASDGSGNNGLYTSAILESIKIPNLTILQMFQNVRSIVSQKSGKQQIPWESTSLTGDFYFYRANDQ